MRIISGTAGGLKITAPKSDRTRPALDQVKEAVFNILFDVSGLRVLDLFAGSGSIGIEALSRGAESATFVEEWDKAVECIRKNLAHCSLESNARILKMQVKKAIAMLSRKEEKFDLIFVDPPYLKNLVNETLSSISRAGIMQPQAVIVVEHHPKEEIREIEGLSLTDQRKYGQTRISFLNQGSG